MRVTYKLSRIGGIGTVGRAQVLVNKSLDHYDLTHLRRKVQAVISTLGNTRWFEKNPDKGPSRDPEELLDIAVRMINEVDSGGHKIVHLEVKIKDLEFYDYEELLQ